VGSRVAPGPGRGPGAATGRMTISVGAWPPGDAGRSGLTTTFHLQRQGAGSAGPPAFLAGGSPDPLPTSLAIASLRSLVQSVPLRLAARRGGEGSMSV